MTKRDVLAFIFRYKNTVLGWWLFIATVVALLAYAGTQMMSARRSTTRSTVCFKPHARPRRKPNRHCLR